MDAKKIIATLFLALVLVPSVFAAVKPVTWTFTNEQGSAVNNIITEVYTCNDDECYVPTSYTPYIDYTSTGNDVLTNCNYGYSALYFFADGYLPMEYMGWVADTNPLSIPVTLEKAENCHAVVDNLNVPYEVENNKPVTINVPVSTLADVHSPFYIVDQAPYYVPVENDESHPLFDHYAADVEVKFELLDEDDDVVLTQTKNIKIFADSTKTVPFSFTTPDETGKYNIRIVTDVTDNQCANSTEDETTKDLIVVDQIPDCYTLINNLEVSEPYPIVNETFDVSAHIFGTVQNQTDTVDVQLVVTKTDDASVVYTETQSNPTDTAFDLTFSWTPTEVDDYDINMYTSIDNTICSAENFEDANILGFYVKPVPTYEMRFHVSDVDQNTVENASIDLENTNTATLFTATTDASGDATITGLYEDDYKFTVSADGYQDYVYPEFHLARDNDAYIVLNPVQPPEYTLTVNVENGLTSAALSGATITLDGPTDANGTSDASGQAVFTELQEGSYNIEVTADGFEAYDSMLLVDANEAITVSLQDINDAPEFTAVAQQTVTELNTLTFTISATDEDELGSLTYSALGLPEGASFDSSTRTFTYTPGLDAADPYTGYAMYDAEFKVQDTRGGSDTMTVSIKVMNTGRTMTASIDCFDEAVLDSEQACTVTALGDDGNALSGATVQFYDESVSIGTGTTNAFGNVVFEYNVTGSNGTHTVTADLVASDYNSISVSSTYLALNHAYDVDYLRVYSDSDYTNEQYTFYRGENLYTKFTVVDVNDGSTIPEGSVVTKMELVSEDGGGRVNLTFDKYESDYYYFKLEPIPLTHDFIGQTGVYAFAIKYTDQSGGEGVAYITILNNPPSIDTMPDTFYVTDFEQEFDLSEYLVDAEGDELDVDLTLSSDDTSVLWLEEDDDTIIYSNVLRDYLVSDAPETYSDIYGDWVDMTISNFDESSIDLDIEDNLFNKSISLKKDAFKRTGLASGYHYFNYLGEIDDYAALSVNPDVVVKQSGNTLTAFAKAEGQTEYLLTVEDKDGEIVEKTITFVVEDFYPEIDIAMSYSGNDIIANRTEITFSTDLDELGFLSGNSYSDAPGMEEYYWVFVGISDEGDLELVYSDSESCKFTPQYVDEYSAFNSVKYIISLGFDNEYEFLAIDDTLFDVLKRARPDSDDEEEEGEIISLYIGDIALPGGLTYHPGQDIIIDLHMENDGDVDFENIKVVTAIPQLQMNREIGPFDLNDNKELTRSIVMPIPEDSDLGEYTIVIDVVDNGVLNRRVGRFIEIIEE